MDGSLVLDSNVINDRNFSRLKKRDSSALELLDSFPHVTVYRLETYTEKNNEQKQRWIKLGAEGAALVAKFGRPPAIRLTILNKTSPLDFCLDISAIKRVKRSGENVMIRCNGGIDIGLGLGPEQDNCTFGMWIPDDNLRQSVEISINKYINMTKYISYDTLLANMKINNANSKTENDNNNTNTSTNTSITSTITDINSNNINKGDMLMKFLKSGSNDNHSKNNGNNIIKMNNIIESENNSSSSTTTTTTNNNNKGEMLMKFLKAGNSTDDKLVSSASTSASTSTTSSPLTISGFDSKETVVNITSVLKQKLSSPELSKLGGNGDTVINITSMMKGKLSSPELTKLNNNPPIPPVTLPPAITTTSASSSSLESLKTLIKVNSSPIINANPDSINGSIKSPSNNSTSASASDLISPSDLLGSLNKKKF